MKKTILAVHGAGMHAGIWGAIVPHLLDYYFNGVILPGHHEDVPGPLLTSIPAMGDFVRSHLEGGAGETILMGHSMGALAALSAADDPRVGALVMLGSAPVMPVNPVFLETAHKKPEEARQMMLKWGVFSGGPYKEAVRIMVGSILDTTPLDAIGADLQACHDFDGAKALAARVKKPVLVISGAEDKMTSAEQGHELAEFFEDNTFVLLDGCGHMIMTEKPIDTALEIKQFLKEKLG